MIYYAQEYHNDKGATIIQNHIMDGLPSDDFPLFIGVGYVQIPTQMGIIDEKILVKIKANNLTEAFDKFQETMERDGPAEVQKVVDNFKRRMMEMQKAQQSRIVTTDKMPPNLPPFQGIVK